MAIRHREVFPEGSSPDSIDWRIWNDDHVGDGGGGDSGIIVSDSDPGAGNDFWLDTSGLQPVLKIRNAADDGWLVVGPRIRELTFTCNYVDREVLVPSGAVGVDIHVGANLIIWGICARTTVLFDDSQAGAGDPPTVENPNNDFTYAVTAAAPNSFGFNADGFATSIASEAETDNLFPLTTGPSGADFIVNFGNLFFGDDGTQGTIVVTFLVSDPSPADDNAKLLPDVTDGVSTITAPGTLEVGDGLVLTEPVAGTAAIAVNKAAFVEPTTATPEAIANALIAAGLMEAS